VNNKLCKLGHGVIGVKLFLYPLQFLFNRRDVNFYAETRVQDILSMTVVANDVELIESLDLMTVRQMRHVQTNEFSQGLCPQQPHFNPRNYSIRKQKFVPRH